MAFEIAERMDATDENDYESIARIMERQGYETIRLWMREICRDRLRDEDGYTKKQAEKIAAVAFPG